MKRISTECDIHAGDHAAKERSLVIDGEALVIDTCDDFVETLRRYSRDNKSLAAADIAGLAPQQIHSPNGSTHTKVAPAKKAPAKKRVAAKAAAPTKTAAPVADANGMRAADSEFPCFVCPKTMKQSSWQSHAQAHGFATAGDMTGITCPLCGDVHGRLTNHAKEKHGIANVALLFQTAIRDGDTHGVVAKQIKKAERQATKKAAAKATKNTESAPV